MYYSIRNRNLQNKNKKRIIFYLILTLCIIVTFSFLGIKFLVYVINIVTDIKKSDTPQASADTIPPKVPSVNSFTDCTNNQTIEIKGNAEPASSVLLYLGSREMDTIVGNTGNFVFKLNLNEGVNKFYLLSKDSSGNVSAKTKSYQITYDITPPILDIISPQNGEVFSGRLNKIIEIKGESEKDATVAINDKFVNLSENGVFDYKIELSNGENQISIKSSDSAGNETTKMLSVSYQE